jgi:hypothetical protein
MRQHPSACVLFMLPAASLFDPSVLPEGLASSLAVFSNPAASIPSLEAAVRHNWEASTAPGEDSKGLELACDIIITLTQTMSQEQWGSLLLGESSSLVQHVTASSRSHMLPSLLVSCMKQLQRSCQCNPQGALRAAALAGRAGSLAVDMFCEPRWLKTVQEHCLYRLTAAMLAGLQLRLKGTSKPSQQRSSSPIQQHHSQPRRKHNTVTPLSSRCAELHS